MLVGGYAVMYHSEPRYTKDIDLFIDRSLNNLEGFAKSMEQFGFPLSQEQLARFAQPDAMIAIGIPPGRIDFLNSVAGLEFGASWLRSEEVDFQGVRVRMISREDLITAKRAVGRAQDLLDLKKLEG
jgi:predicted nucleotidyltransferase